MPKPKLTHHDKALKKASVLLGRIEYIHNKPDNFGFLSFANSLLSAGRLLIMQADLEDKIKKEGSSAPSNTIDPKTVAHGLIALNRGKIRKSVTIALLHRQPHNHNMEVCQEIIMNTQSRINPHLLDYAIRSYSSLAAASPTKANLRTISRALQVSYTLRLSTAQEESEKALLKYSTTASSQKVFDDLCNNRTINDLERVMRSPSTGTNKALLNLARKASDEGLVDFIKQESGNINAPQFVFKVFKEYSNDNQELTKLDQDTVNVALAIYKSPNIENWEKRSFLNMMKEESLIPLAPAFPNMRDLQPCSAAKASQVLWNLLELGDKDKTSSSFIASKEALGKAWLYTSAGVPSEVLKSLRNKIFNELNAEDRSHIIDASN